MMMVRWLVLAGLAVIVSWSVAASYLWCYWSNVCPAEEWRLLQWWFIAPYFRANWYVTILFIGSALVPTGCIAVIAAIGFCMTGRRRLRRPLFGSLKPIERGVTKNHGDSDWRSMKDARELFPGPDPVYGGVVVGEAYRVDQDRAAGRRFLPHDKSTWGIGGNAPLLIDPCQSGSGSTHSIVVGGPGSYKSVSAVTTILHWTGSSVILDPSQELGPMLDAALRSQGKRVFHIGFDDMHGLIATGVNVLAWIDIRHPEAQMHIRSVTSWIYDEDAAKSSSKSEDPFFTNMGKNLVSCLLAHMMWSDGNEPKTLSTLAEALSIPEKEMMGMLEHIYAHSKSPMARRLAGTLMGCRAPETFSGIYLNSFNGTSWLALDSYSKTVSQGAFDPKFLLDGDTTVFLNISLATLEHTASIAKTIVGGIMNAVYMADGKAKGRVLFLLDEASRLGRMKVLETARDAGRKYGITMQLLLQSMGQLHESWGEQGYRSWLDAVSWIAYGSIQAGSSGKALSEQLGTHAIMAVSESRNSGSSGGMNNGSRSRGWNKSWHEIKHNVATAAELQQNLRADELVVIPNSGMPIRCGRAIYFRRPKEAAMVNRNRFVKIGEGEAA